MEPLKNNFCPVCGYDLGFSSWNGSSASDEICPCCGIQFGLDDMAGGDINKRNLIYNEWRNQWIKEGMPWKSIGIEQPENWDPANHLNKLMEYSAGLLKDNMNKRFSVELCSDIDYEEMVMNISWDDNTVAILNQENGIENIEIEIFSASDESWRFAF